MKQEFWALYREESLFTGFDVQGFLFRLFYFVTFALRWVLWAKILQYKKNLLRNGKLFLCVECLASLRRLPDLVQILETSQSKNRGWFLFLMLLTDKDCWESLSNVHPVTLTHLGNVLMFVSVILQRQAKLLETLVNYFLCKLALMTFYLFKKKFFGSFIGLGNLLCDAVFSVLPGGHVSANSTGDLLSCAPPHEHRSRHQCNAPAFAAMQKENSSSYLTRHSIWFCYIGWKAKTKQGCIILNFPISFYSKGLDMSAWLIKQTFLHCRVSTARYSSWFVYIFLIWLLEPNILQPPEKYKPFFCLFVF